MNLGVNERHNEPDDDRGRGSSIEQSQQRVLSIETVTAKDLAVMGEKAVKLFKMKSAGLNVPNFFVVVGNESGELVVNSELSDSFAQFRKPVIARSAHVDEGREHPFSGVFISLKGITQLVQERPDFAKIRDETKRRDAEWDFYEKDPEVLTEAYRLICEVAQRSHHVERYLEDRGIDDFNPLQMNLIVMEEVEVRVFGMFVTSDQNNPNLVHIHYSQPRAESETSEESHFEIERGGVVTYDRQREEILDENVDEELRPILLRFGQQAGQVEELFGVQQVEMCSDGDEVFLLQSRTINLGDAKDTPRFATYKNLPGEYRAIGYGFHSLPVIVVDSIQNTSLAYRYSDEEYKALTEAASGTDFHSEEWKAVEAYTQTKRLLYQQKLSELKERLGNYALVIRDAEDVVTFDLSDPFSGKSYDFINELSKDAVVAIQGRNQNAIRHDDWDKVEIGGLRIIPSEDGRFMDCFRYDGETPFPASNRVVSGEVLNVLSNIDGTFIWPARWDEVS